MKIATLSGSLRQASRNTALLRAAGELAPSSLTFHSLSIGQLPLYNDDLKSDEELREVLAFRAAIGAADGVLIATPEYNYGIPGPLKNAIDWASRPAYRSAFFKKPVGILGASGGVVGTARAQGQLKQVLLGMASQVFPHPELLVGQSEQKFDESGRLTDETSRELLGKFLVEFERWVAKVR